MPASHVLIPALPPKLRKSLRTCTGNAPLFFVTCFLFFAGRSPFLGQWDSFDYLKQTVTHKLSDLAFGRPVFIGYNILLWEASRRLFGLDTLQVESVATAGVILLGVCGVFFFRRLARRLLPPPLDRMATLAFLLSPMYAVYAGSVMTEVPMMATLLAAAVIIWETGERHPLLGPVAGGILFGLAVGIREQAVTLAAAGLWILWGRRPDPRSRLNACLLFGAASFATIAAPILALYLLDPPGFFARTRTWLHAIPTGQTHLLKNVQSSLLFTLAACPGSWLALAAGGILRGCRSLGLLRRPKRKSEVPAALCDSPGGIAKRTPYPILGFFCAFALPMAVLWRDADVQIHPRYLMILLPAAIILCVNLYSRLLGSISSAVGWAVLQIVIFGAAAVALEPVRQVQYERKEFARLVRESAPDGGLLIPGAFSPVLDYYRGLGIRPDWNILWSGWGWSSRRAEAVIRETWSRQEPVVLCDGPYGWLLLEDERLDLHFILKDCRREALAPGITRYYPYP